LVDQDRYEEALMQLESLTDNGLLQDCWNKAWIGDVLRWMGRHDDAVAAYERVLADYPYCGYPAGWALAGIAMTQLARGNRSAVRQALDRAATTGWAQWAFRAAINPRDEEALRDLQKNGDGRYLYDVACCLDAYARGDDATAMGHAQRLAKQWHWQKWLLWRDGQELQKLLAAEPAG
jgi:tetratricopeptide (TPR) repeat protein